MEPLQPDSSLRIPALICGAALIITASIAAYAYDHAHPADPQTMTVTGSTERLVDSDIVKWSIAISRYVGLTI